VGDSGNTDAPVQGWAGLLAELVKSFLILRDVFGYALPGAVFFGVGLVSGRITLRQASDLLQPYALPIWAGIVLSVVVFYITGHILAAIAYAPYDVYKLFASRHAVWSHPTELTGELLAIGQTRPRLLVQLERRETMALLNHATLAALLSGCGVFYYWQPSPAHVFLIAGCLLLPTVGTAMFHLQRVRTAVRRANDLVQPPTGPDEDKAVPPAANVVEVTVIDDER
jgi:hypothetical protein